jgi:carboxypeptidase D
VHRPAGPQSKGGWTNVQPKFDKMVFRMLLLLSLLLSILLQVKSEKAYLVTSRLPGVNYSDPRIAKMEHYAGIVPIYVDGVKSKHNPGLFFWMFRAQSANASKLVIWLNGGPGCSSLLGALAGHAPLRFDDDGNIHFNPNAWNADADLLYLDQPVGTGYSFVHEEAQIPLKVTRASRDFVQFVRKLYILFPDLASKDLYITGESYAGVWIPYFSKAIVDDNQVNPNVIPLKGIAVGNGLIWPEVLYETFVEWPILHGYLPNGPTKDNATKTLKECQKAYREGHEFIHIPVCDSLTDIILSANLSNGDCRNWYDMRLVMPNCNLDAYPKASTYLDKYLIDPQVIEALHVKSPKKPIWQSCDALVESKMNYDPSVPPYKLLPWILENGVQVLLYSGQHDLACNSLQYEWGIGNLTWGGITGFSHDGMLPYIVDGVSKGKVWTERNLTYLLIHDSGHMVPYDAPKVSLDVLGRFIHSSSMPLNDGHARVKDKVWPWFLIITSVLMSIVLMMWSVVRSSEYESV